MNFVTGLINKYVLTIKLAAVSIGCIISPIQLLGQTGPGGVGNSTSNTLWVSADNAVFNDAGTTPAANGDSIEQWNDLSGNNNHATQTTAAYKATYLTGEINGLPIIRFDGIDDYFDDARSYSARSVYIVYKTVSTLMQTSDLGQIWGSYAENVHVALDARGGNLRGWSFDGGGTNKGRYGINSAAFGGFAEDNNTSQWTYDAFEIVSVEFEATRAITRQVLGSLVPSFAVGAHQYGGDVAEILVFNTTHNGAQRIIIENYLAAKYQLDIAASGNDFFAYEATHGIDVAGIGRHAVGETHTSATSASILNLSNPLTLNADGEYLIFGHNNASVAAWTTTEAPNGGTNIQRLNREWRLDETGDVGTLTFTIDTSIFAARPAGYSKFVLLVDSDGDFSSGASIYEMTSPGGDEFYAIDEIDIADGDYITIGCIHPTVNFQTAESSGLETVTNPVITVQLNYIPANDVTVDYTSADGTAVAPDDYTALGATLTILAGNDENTITLTIVNDVDFENDETFTITLSNPSVGVNLGSVSTHTYTIYDDDNSRKIYFISASSNGDESTSPVSITVEINSVDLVNPTSVDYAVTGGTATGGGVDYTLASGTLTIPANNTTNTFDIVIVDDALNEADETIIITLSNTANCNLSSVDPVVHTYTINDNDAAPNIQFSSVTSSGSEAITSVDIEVKLSALSGTDVSVDYDVTGGTATGGGVDYTLVSGTLTITAENLSNNITLSVVDDNTQELSETIEIELSNVSNATLGDDTIHTYTIIDDDPFGYMGPAGVGNNSSNVLWLMADIGVYNDTGTTEASDGETVQQWEDQSGNGNHAFQATAGYRPTFETNEVNTLPVVRFDGTDDYFDDTRAYSARSVYIVYKTVSTLMQTTDLGQIWGNYAENVHVALDARTDENLRGWSFDGNGTTKGKYGIDGAAYGAFVNNGNTSQWSYDQFQMVAAEFDNTKDITRQVIGSLVPFFPVGEHQFGGDIAEIIVFNTLINDAQRIIFENYLSSKYGIAITNDKYAYDASYGNEVAGIGRINASNFHLDAQGTSIVRINNPSSLDDNDFMLWGHDNASYVANTTDVPSGVDNRLNRIWEVDETGDVGTVRIYFDLSSFTINDPASLVLLIDNDDGSFTNATIYDTGLNYSGGVVYFTGVDFGSRKWFTIGSKTAGNPLLPIELLNFDVTCDHENDAIDVSWTTASETNNDYFTLYRSTNGSEFTEITRITGSGTTSQVQSYSYKDNHVPPTGDVYYKLDQTDFNGTTKNYTVTSINCFPLDNQYSVKVFPNPFRDQLNIIFTNWPDEQTTLRLIDMQGRILLQKNAMIQGVKTQLTFNLNACSPGLYILNLRTDKVNKNLKIEKQ